VAAVTVRRWRGARLGLAYALLATLSCDSPLSPDSASVDRVEVNPASLQLTAGETRTVTARVLDADGASLVERRPFWSTQNPQVATVSQSGVVTAVAAGNTTVAASAGGKSGLVQVAVGARPVSQVRIAPTSASVEQGAMVTLRADPVDATGGSVTGRPVFWATSDAAIATVTSTGVVTGIAPGAVTITATVDGVDGTAAVTVTPVPVASVTVSPSSGSLEVGQTLQLSATTASAGGQTLTGRVVIWSSTSSTVATVSSTGLVLGVAPGVATISATSEGRTGTAQVSVAAVPVASIRIAPPSATLPAGQKTLLSAQALDANGNVLNRTITWTTDLPTVATVAQDGQVTAVNTGTAHITAAVGSVSATATITVTAVPVATLTVTPSSANLVVGATQQLTAIPRDGQGNVLPGRTITWISGAPGIATVTQTGLVTAVGAGTAIIFAATEGVSGGATIIVGSAPVTVASVTLVPNAATLSPGATVTLVPTILDTNGLPVSPAGRTIVFTTSDAAVATVSAGGVVTGVAAGSATITCTVDGVPGTAAITVSAVPIASITVTPNPAGVEEGSTVTLTATAFDAGNNVLTGRTFFWTSNNALVSVSQTGVVTALISGGGVAATITASAPGGGAGGTTPSATATVNVSWAPVATATLTPSSQNLSVGATTQFALALQSAGGQVLPATGRTVAWTSLDPAVATVSTAGVVSGVASGTARIEVSASSPGQATPARDTALVNVQNQAPVAQVTLAVAPDSTILPGTPLSGTVTVRDAASNLLSNRTVTLASSSTAIATVAPASGTTNASGQLTGISVTGVSAGNATITAASEGITSAPFTARILNPVNSVTVAAVSDSVIGTGGAPVQATATLLDVNSATLTGRPVAWASSNTAVATVDGTGLITSVAVGSTSISATSEGKTGALTWRVLAPVATVTASTLGDSVLVGGTLQATATLRDAGSNVLTGRSVTWASSDPTRATVSAAGLITGVAVGTTNITATSEGQTSAPLAIRVVTAGIASITLAPATDSIIGSGTLALTATATSILGGPAQGQTLTVTSGTPAVATVSPPSGATNAAGQLPITVTWVSPGTSLLTVSGGTQSVTRTLRMLAPVASVSVTAPADSIIGTGTLQATATLLDAASSILTGRVVTWATSDPNVATVSSTGLVTGVSPGTVNVTATSEGQSSLPLAVRVLASVATVTVTAPDSSIFVGQTQQATAVLRDAASNVLTGRPVAWSSSNAAKATVSSSGLITAIDSGTAGISATAEGKSGSMPFAVALVPVGSVAFPSGTETLQVNQSRNLQLQVLDINNSNAAGRACTMLSQDTTRVTVSPASGTTNGAGKLSVTITGVALTLVPADVTATCEGVQGKVSVTVIP
jgi:uncharacterized protein YjdB